MLFRGCFLLVVALFPFFGMSFRVYQPNQSNKLLIVSKMSEWGDFQAMENDLLDDDTLMIDTREYATEHDSPELKAQVGRQLDAPTIDHDVPPLFVPLGMCFICEVSSSYIYLFIYQQLCIIFHLSLFWSPQDHDWSCLKTMLWVF